VPAVEPALVQGLMASTPDMQPRNMYGVDPPGKADMTIVSVEQRTQLCWQLLLSALLESRDGKRCGVTVLASQHHLPVCMPRLYVCVCSLAGLQCGGGALQVPGM
jgi:hypothetical protein